MFLPIVHQITPLLERGLPLSAYANPTARHTTYIPDRDVYDLSHPLPPSRQRAIRLPHLTPRQFIAY